MTKELQNAIRHIKTRSDAWAVKVIEDALEQEPCNDAINREEAIDQLDQSINILEATDRIKALPSVRPSRKVGHWIDYSDEGYVECPYCEHATTCEDNIDELHYCFYCGAELSADMSGKENG